MIKFSEYSKIPGIKINENVVKIGSSFKVTLTYDVPLTLVKDYIDKIKKETNKNVLELFGAEHIAEEMMKYTLTQFMTIDNLKSEAIVGENVDLNDVIDNVKIKETDTAAEEQEKSKTEEKSEKKEKSQTKEEEEEDYMNIYTASGKPVSTGFKITPLTQHSKTSVGLHEGLKDSDIK